MSARPAALLAVVLPGLSAYRRLLHALGDSPLVASTEFSVQAPLFKGSDAIKAALARAQTVWDKLDVYFDHAILNEEERVRFAGLFARDYARKHPRFERSDLFVASGDVFGFSFELRPPLQAPVPRVYFDAIAAGPHDAALLARLRGGEPVDRALLKASLHLFLDHVHNPRRLQDAAVRRAAAAIGAVEPVVAEVRVAAGVPGYMKAVLEPLTDDVGGAVCWLSDA
jgi:hypothetical protein